jgi:FlaA1/EpsC-like NDP-sugar epimerase
MVVLLTPQVVRFKDKHTEGITVKSTALVSGATGSTGSAAANRGNRQSDARQESPLQADHARRVGADRIR